MKVIRLQNYDYSQSGRYFVTICTKNRVSYLGKICEGKMELSEAGKVVERFWNNIPKHAENVKLDAFVVMPDHVHGIIFIKNDLVGTCHGMSLQEYRYNKFGKPISGSLSVIVNQFKSAVTRECKQRQISFKWQEQFYERIIRNEEALYKIRKYIINNPVKWELNTEYG